MLRRWITLLFLWPLATAVTAEDVTFSGTIGPYPIEAELRGDAKGAVTGRYRYVGKPSWLTLMGEVYGQDALEIAEHSDGTQTGAFFLNVFADTLVGYWVAGEKDHPVQLELKTGQMAEIVPQVPPPDISPALTGRYSTGRYWVNDWFAPNYEVGFNGGDVNVVQIDENTLLIRFDFVVGPTYHFAFFQGFAQRVADRHFVHDAVLPGGNGPCKLSFRFEGDQLRVTDNHTSSACQFGARAHANFDLTKVSDTAEFQESW